MKIEKQKLLRSLSGLAVCTTIAVCATFTSMHNDYTYSRKELNQATSVESTDDEPSSSFEDVSKKLEYIIQEIVQDKKEADYAEYLKTRIVYDGMTMDELAEKLEKNLNSTLDGTGRLFAEYSIELGLDPYLATSIVLLETGCSWQCSSLLNQCNNVGGIKGSPSCAGGSYRRYDSLEVGIKEFLNYLYHNYYAQGLKTAEQINPKYAESKTWAQKVNMYIEKIKAS